LTYTRNFRSGKIHAVVGPNIAHSPTEIENELILSGIKYVLVPSEWTRALFAQESPKISHKIRIWASGVDENFWSPKTPTLNKKIVVIYIKDFSSHILTPLRNFLQQKRIEWIEIVYGDHRPVDYFEALNRASACITVGHTESQGIYQFEAWSMNVPTLIFANYKSQKFSKLLDLFENDEDKKFAFGPYLNDINGFFWQNLNELEAYLTEILLESNNLNPRDFVLQNFTLLKGANSYLSFFNL